MLRRCIPLILVVLLCSLLYADDTDTRALDLCRKTSQEFKDRMSGLLHDTILSDGILGAIDACATGAEKLSTELSREPGLRIERVTQLSLRELKRGNSFENKSLSAMIDSAEAGMPVPEENHEWIETSKTERKLVYVVPLKINPVCLACHGPAPMVQPDVRTVMQTKYHALPSGNKIGDVKGALVVTLELPAGQSLLKEMESKEKTEAPSQNE
jgi:hypothetical protein